MSHRAQPRRGKEQRKQLAPRSSGGISGRTTVPEIRKEARINLSLCRYGHSNPALVAFLREHRGHRVPIRSVTFEGEAYTTA